MPAKHSLRGNDAGIRARIAVLKKFQRAVHAQKSEIAQLIAREAGKPYVEALLTEVMVVLDAARFLIDNAYSVLRDEPLPHGSLAVKAKSGRLVREPYGVIGVISPWNYPFSIPATETLAALVAGNAVVLKPSEFTSLIARKLADLLHGAGVPDDVFQVLVGGGPTGKALCDSAIDKLIFTGSVATGKRIAQAAAARLLPVVLEHGAGGLSPEAREGRAVRSRRGASRRAARGGGDVRSCPAHLAAHHRPELPSGVRVRRRDRAAAAAARGQQDPGHRRGRPGRADPGARAP